jgi:hypothetical protein
MKTQVVNIVDSYEINVVTSFDFLNLLLTKWKSSFLIRSIVLEKSILKCELLLVAFSLRTKFEIVLQVFIPTGLYMNYSYYTDECGWERGMGVVAEPHEECRLDIPRVG